jgi:integrase
MIKVLLRNVTIEDDFFDKLYVFQDDSGSVIFLPLLWAIHLSKTDSIYGWRTTRKNGGSSWTEKSSATENFEARIVAENTIDNYISHVFRFLQYVNDIHKSNGTPSVHHTHEISSRVLNQYLNEVLANHLSSKASLIAHQAAISAYYNFLYSLRIKDQLVTNIPRKTLQKIAELNEKEKKINYISRSDRSALLRASNSLRDRLILRTGFEAGLRAEENTGLILKKHNAKLETHPGLLDLFDELDTCPLKQSFEYLLNGKYTKGGKSRYIYFNRELLIDLRDYYLNERQLVMKQANISCNTLFVKTDPLGRGSPITRRTASKIFTKARRKCPHMNVTLGYHDLRHTFATELYHEELHSPAGHETRSESAALIVVQNRLGHASDSSTKRYIRMRLQMLAIEGEN